MASEKELLETIGEQARQVERLLRPEEACTFAAESFLLKNGKKKPRRVAIVVSRKSDSQGCFFMLKEKRRVTLICEVRPILEDFAVEIANSGAVKPLQESIKPFSLDPGLVVHLRFAKDDLYFEMPNFDMMAKFIAELKQMHVSAVTEQQFTVTKSIPVWSLYYSQASAELINILESGNGAETAGNMNVSLNEPHIGSENPFMASTVKDGSDFVQESYSKIKSAWIAKQLVHREKEFTEYTSLKIFAGTWNVNGRHCNENLGPYLNYHLTGVGEPDLYVLGFQELDLSAQAFLLDNSGREDDWSKLIEASFKKKGAYKKVASKQLVGLLLLVYAKQELIPSIKGIQTESAGTGILGMMGNKGGVGIRLKIHDSTFCFLNSHLAAGSEELERRNADFKEICRKLLFSLQDPNEGTQYSTIFDSDYLIWLGDFNYRLSLPDTEARALIENREYAKALKYDQLSTQRLARKAFGGFEEAPINFTPSYKYDPGTDTFDTSEKRRAPAWCDRILWRSGDKLENLVYTCHMELKTSDHKPVSSIFEASKVKIFSKEKMNEIQMEMLRELDKFENECMPDATLSQNHLDFGDVKYLVPGTKGVVLENTGQVLLQFQFIPKLEETAICKPWVWVSPSKGMLLPGEKIVISVTVLVDQRTAPKLNKEPNSLEDILVLHLVNGKDMFVLVSGRYIPTCFGTSLETLVRLASPIRDPKSPNHEKKVLPNPQLSVPKEIWRLADYIYKHGLDQEGLFVTGGDAEEMAKIRDCLDEGRDFDFGDNPSAVFSVAETLVRLLDALPEPVIPFSMYQRCVDSYQSYQMAKQATAQIPTVHYNVFAYLTAFLREVYSHSSKNGLEGENLALIFSSVILRSPKMVSEKYRDAVDKKKAAFLMHFINVQTE